MYKCSDCGREYQEKPDFCECGNNIFEEININAAPKRTVQNQEIDQIVPNNNDDKFYIFLGLIIFIMFFLALLFVGIKNIKAKNQTEEKPSEVKEVQQVKTENTTPESQSAPKVIKQVFVDTLTNLAPKSAPEQVQKSEQPVKTANQPKKTEAVKSVVKEAKKQQTDPVKTAPKTVKPTKTVSQQPKQQQSAPQKPIQPQTTKPQNTAPQQTQSSSQLPNLKMPVQTPVNTAELKKELLQYKILLRNKISADINFINVIGDGTCVITFKISSSGKLTNRAFAKQSDNDSLNDAVYSAVMRHPAFNPPPAGYKNETLRLTVKKFGSNFEVDLS